MKKCFTLSLLACAAATALFAGAARAEVNININLGMPVVTPAPAPVWAPAPGAAVVYSYYYYPSFGIYFDSNRGIYFYMEGNVWRQSRNRPPFMAFHDHDYVILDMGDADPHPHHVRVIGQYPPGYFKEHKWEKEKYKGKGRDDDQGEGKGKHKGKRD